MDAHWCLNDDYPGGAIPCLCVRGEDHDEALFDVPVSPTGDDLADPEDWED